MKMSIKKFILLFVIFCSGAYLSWAQEYILPMGGNPALAGNVPENNKKSLSAISSVDLPFADDFSGRSPYPSSTLWANKYAFINDGFAVNPPTIGVATLDAIDEHGSVYATATISPETFVADSLTSLPINLAYTPADSIYLSFFYQPTGNGLQPGTYDSLCLDFYAVDSGVWNTVWAIPGDTLSAFRQVMVPIKDTIYLKDGFRFAFHNRASLPSNTDYKDKRGNVDHWNIDYVRLDKDRFRTDTVIRDVAFTSPTPSMISGYQALPWKHFKSAYNTKYLGAITFLYQNNDSADRNVTRYLSYEDIVWNETFSPGSPSTQDIFAGTSTSYSYSGIYPFDFDRGDTAIIRIKSWLKTDDFDNKVNDTLYRDRFSWTISPMTMGVRKEPMD